jgi:hypothetical protein
MPPKGPCKASNTRPVMINLSHHQTWNDKYTYPNNYQKPGIQISKKVLKGARLPFIWNFVLLMYLYDVLGDTKLHLEEAMSAWGRRSHGGEWKHSVWWLGVVVAGVYIFVKSHQTVLGMLHFVKGKNFF